MTSQQRFEQWLLKEWGDGSLDKDEDNNYIHSLPRTLWAAYQEGMKDGNE